jgi:CBS domain-containing protein
VRDLMTLGVATCDPDTPASEVARMMLEKGWEEVVVVENRHAIGVVGPEELVRAYNQENAATLTAESIMREGLPAAPADIPASTAAQIMLDLGVRTLYITHHAGGIEFPTAFISTHHILRHMAAQNENDLRDLGISAEREPPLQAFIKRRDEARRQRASRSHQTGNISSTRKE